MRATGMTLALIVLAGIAISTGWAAEATDYKLVWADEFDKDGRPDPNNWTYERGFVRNEELQWYQPENAWCQGDMLIIEGRRERKPNPGYDSDSNSWRRNRQYIEYTSACLKTPGLHSWTYGRFEMRAKIDTRSGLWPAFWTLGSARQCRVAARSTSWSITEACCSPMHAGPAPAAGWASGTI